MRIIAVLMITLTICACSRQTETVESKPAPKPSTIQTAVEGVTGYTAVKQGKKAEEKIIDISKQQNKELDEVLE